MAGGYALSPAARADVEEIWDYTLRHWGEAQAERYMRNIGDACEALGNGTLTGRSAEDIRAGYRKAAVGSHVVFYWKLGLGGEYRWGRYMLSGAVSASSPGSDDSVYTANLRFGMRF